MLMSRFSRAPRLRNVKWWSFSKPAIIDNMPFEANQIARKKPNDINPLRSRVAMSSMVLNKKSPAVPGITSSMASLSKLSKLAYSGVYASRVNITMIEGKSDKKKSQAMLLARVTIASSWVSRRMKTIKLYRGIRFSPGKECVLDHSKTRIHHE